MCSEKVNDPTPSENAKTGYKVIGKQPNRQDGTDKVTGRAKFGADIHLPGMLYGCVLRSPHAHARILSIDTSRVKAYPGVYAIITAEDFPHPERELSDADDGAINLRNKLWNILAQRKVLYHGHPVAAIAASSLEVANKALELIQVDYEVLPPVLDVREAMLPDALLLIEDNLTDEMGKKSEQPSNIAAHYQFKSGDVARGFQMATVIVESEFTTSMIHQGYIEPQSATAMFNPDGQLTIWSSTQGSFGVRDEVGQMLGIPISKIRVIPMEIGGGFGGKNAVYLEPLAALLSLKCGYRPVKMTMSREEVFSATGPASGSYMRVKLGANREGRLIAAEATLIYEAGAFPGSSVGSGMGVMFGPYKIEHILIDGYDVLVNKPQTSTYRAPGGTNAVYAAEVMVDMMCEKLDMDALDFRLLNGVREGDRSTFGSTFKRIGFIETLEAAKKHPHYTDALRRPNRGRGLACGFWFNYGGNSSVSASLNPDGSVSLVEGSVDIGGSRASIAMQMAEAMEIPIESVRVSVGDTDAVGYTEGTYGSRTTFATGWAAYEVGKKLVGELTNRAAKLWEVEVEKVHYKDGIFATPDESITLRELAEKLSETGGPIMATATVHPTGSGPSFATHIVDVEVDTETGKVNILRYTAVQDVGKAIYPQIVEGQIQGGVAQGIGWAMNEEYLYDAQGKLINTSFLDYRMPVTLDLPMIEPVLVEVANPGHPYGVRGVGEVPIVPPPGAVANAIYHAIGVRLNRLPMSPGRVLEAIQAKK